MPTIPQTGNETIYVVRAPLVRNDRDNSLYRDWEAATETEYLLVNVQPFMMAEKLNFEINTDREYVRTAFRFMSWDEVDVLPTDKIRRRGELYEVFGEPGRWYRFNGAFHHVSWIARLVDG